jgi:hypothetical protein
MLVAVLLAVVVLAALAAFIFKNKDVAAVAEVEFQVRRPPWLGAHRACRFTPLTPTACSSLCRAL